MNTKKFAILAVHAFIGWALCAATMGIGMTTTTLDNTLIIHAIGAPIFFIAVSFAYFSKFNSASPTMTALYFLIFVISVDFFIVALIINKSLEMFKSPLGTWIPFSLIFLSSYITGYLKTKT
jgi:hypothetical protein